MTTPPFDLDVVRTSHMDMAVHLPAGTPISDEVAARWRAGGPSRGASAGVDDNRFSMTWPRRPREPFPSYRACWPAFAADLDSLQRAFADNGAGEAAFSDCELTYVNPVTFEEQSPRQGRLERLIVQWLVPDHGDGWLPSAERIVADATFPMAPDTDGAPGRLSVRMQTLPTETSEPLFAMALSALCLVDSPEVDAVESAFDVAFDWIVRGYATFGEPAVPLG